jgi:hypothetical protein
MVKPYNKAVMADRADYTVLAILCANHRSAAARHTTALERTKEIEA